jgi:hypothetical protein
MAEKKIQYQETYKKNVIYTDKDHIIKLIKSKDSILYAVKAGKYEDGKEFITLTIDNL